MYKKWKVLTYIKNQQDVINEMFCDFIFMKEAACPITNN